MMGQPEPHTTQVLKIFTKFKSYGPSKKYPPKYYNDFCILKFIIIFLSSIAKEWEHKCFWITLEREVWEKVKNKTEWLTWDPL